MQLKELIEYCLTKKGSWEDRPFGPESLAIKVSSRIFALFSNKSGKPSVSLKCDPFVAKDLRQQYTAITPGYHLNKEHWNTVILDGSIPDSEIFWMIDHSYEMAVKCLTREERDELTAS